MIPKPCFADCDAVVRKDLAAHINVNSYSLDGSIALACNYTAKRFFLD